MQTSRTNFNFSGYLLSSVEILRSLSDDFEILVLYISFHSSLSLFDGRRNDESDPSSYLWRWDCSRLYSPMRDRHVRPQVGCLHEEDASGTNVSPALRSAANVSSWSGGIAFFLNVAFRQSLKRLNCPPVDLRPSFNSPYSTRRGCRFQLV